MIKHKLNIFFRVLAVVLTIAVLSPVAVKLMHSFNHHEHEVCQGYTETHLHSLDLDCEFFKFKLSNELNINVYNYKSTISTVDSYSIRTLYILPYTHQHLSFSLRAPPTSA